MIMVTFSCVVARVSAPITPGLFARISPGTCIIAVSMRMTTNTTAVSEEILISQLLDYCLILDILEMLRPTYVYDQLHLLGDGNDYCDCLGLQSPSE